MGSVSPAAAAAGWTADDDLLLKSAVEAGASLESLAKGAVCFSHKFTLQELRDRWYSLLYDSETSAQASDRMAEYGTELLTSNPAKACKLLSSKEKGFSGYKRQIDSVKVQYHARIKRVCHEPCLSSDLGYSVVPCSCARKDGGGCACGCQLKCSEDHQCVHKVNPPSGGSISSYGCGGGSDGDRQHVPSNGNEHLSKDNDHSDGRIMIDGDSNHGSLDTQFHNPVASMSTSAQAEGSDSENSVPDYVDIDALILEQDLIPWDQESDFIQPEVSRFCSPEGRKDLMKLEKGAYSSMDRSIMSKRAFAIIYGQRLIYYIRDTEVTLGRGTGEVHVDIDLGKDGNANKISRQQAIIKMDSDGSFYMTNIGKGSIFVNSKEVPCNKRILLSSDSIIEIRKLRFNFHVNETAVRQHIIRAMRGNSDSNNTTFDWNQNA